ncbi:MAG: hypothetical protein KGK07_07335 [Chloroflexota bacterium]|nr:hypothetical protein [Chloroflexota bacterium]
MSTRTRPKSLAAHIADLLDEDTGAEADDPVVAELLEQIAPCGLVIRAVLEHLTDPSVVQDAAFWTAVYGRPEHPEGLQEEAVRRLAERFGAARDDGLREQARAARYGCEEAGKRERAAKTKAALAEGLASALRHALEWLPDDAPSHVWDSARSALRQWEAGA